MCPMVLPQRATDPKVVRAMRRKCHTRRYYVKQSHRINTEEKQGSNMCPYVYTRPTQRKRHQKKWKLSPCGTWTQADRSFFVPCRWAITIDSNGSCTAIHTSLVPTTGIMLHWQARPTGATQHNNFNYYTLELGPKNRRTSTRGCLITSHRFTGASRVFSSVA